MRSGPLDRSGGIILNITGQVLQNLAAVLMSFGQQGPQSRRRKIIWYVGVILIVIGALAVFASYGVAEQSLLGSLISVQFVSNMFFCRVILRKTITPLMFLGTGVIVGGTLLCILNAPHVDHDIDEDDMERLYLRNPVFQRFLLGEAMFWILMDKLYSTYVDAQHTGRRQCGQEVMLPCMFVARAALPGSFSVVAAKNLAVLLRLTTTEGRNMFANALLWLNLFFWLGGTAYWMRRMNHALALFNGAFIIPLCQVNWSCFTIVTGGVFFEEFKHFSLEDAVLFTLGLVMNFAGVMLLHQKKRSNKVKDPDCSQTYPEEGLADEEPPNSLTHTASLEHSFPAFRGRPVKTISKASNSTEVGSVLSSNSAGSSRERKHLINPVGLIPLVLDGVQEEHTESFASTSARREDPEPPMQVLDRLARLEEANKAQHLEVLGKIADLVSALNLPKGVKPVPTTSSETGTPVASGSTTPQLVPPDAPLPPSTPLSSVTPLSVLPTEGPQLLPPYDFHIDTSKLPLPHRPSPSPRQGTGTGTGTGAGSTFLSPPQSARPAAPVGDTLPPLKRLSLPCCAGQPPLATAAAAAAPQNAERHCLPPASLVPAQAPCGPAGVPQAEQQQQQQQQQEQQQRERQPSPSPSPHPSSRGAGPEVVTATPAVSRAASSPAQHADPHSQDTPAVATVAPTPPAQPEVQPQPQPQPQRACLPPVPPSQSCTDSPEQEHRPAEGGELLPITLGKPDAADLDRRDSQAQLLAGTVQLPLLSLGRHVTAEGMALERGFLAAKTLPPLNVAGETVEATMPGA